MNDALLPMRLRNNAPYRNSVIGRTGLDPSPIYGLIRTGDFLKPLKLGRSSLWPESEIAHWIEVRKSERQRAA